MQPCTLVWFRRNLRRHDNAALSEAARYGRPVVGIWIGERPSESSNPRRAVFHYQSAAELHRRLAGAGMALYAVFGDAGSLLPEQARKLNAQTVVADEAYTAEETACDNRIQTALEAEGIGFVKVNDRTVFAKAELMDEHGIPYTDFPRYRLAWRAAFARKIISTEPVSAALSDGCGRVAEPFPVLSGFAPPVQRGGEEAAWAQWQRFAKQADFYETLKDFPAKKGSSMLGAYLAAGCISPRLLAQEAYRRGAEGWLDNLIRRDFYQQLAFHRRNDAAAAVQGRENRQYLQAWLNGRTGFPLLDAAMRCLGGTGMLHPRLRVLAAEFFCKILMLPVEEGITGFARLLADEEPAANIGNWREMAADRRMPLSPELQALKLDPGGRFVRRYVPELAHLPSDLIHAPHSAAVDTHGYPPPLADWAAQAALFGKLSGSGR